MKKLLSTFALILALVTVGYAATQRSASVTLHEAVTVGSNTLPAGDYSLRWPDGSGVVELSISGHHHNLSVPVTVTPPEKYVSFGVIVTTSGDKTLLRGFSTKAGKLVIKDAETKWQDALGPGHHMITDPRPRQDGLLEGWSMGTFNAAEIPDINSRSHSICSNLFEVEKRSMHSMSRRTFATAFSAAAAVAALPGFAIPPLRGVRFGYAAITWGAEERQAMDDISAVGYPGVQFRNNAVQEFKPEELKDLLAQHKLTFVALSSGEISLDKPAEDEIARHLKNAEYTKKAGGLYMQVLDRLKPYPRKVTKDECLQLGKVLNELGKRMADINVPMGYHNHLNTISEHPENLDLVMENTDPRYVKLELDTAHLLAGGGDPAKAVERYHDRLLFMHLKDVVSIPVGTPGSQYPFKFVELGRGKVDFPAVFAAVKAVGFKGWAVVELDRVPDEGKMPKQCAEISRNYLTQKLGVNV